MLMGGRDERREAQVCRSQVAPQAASLPQRAPSLPGMRQSKRRENALYLVQMETCRPRRGTQEQAR